MNETSCLAQWMRDPAWLSMDPTAQGFHTRLLLLAAGRRPRGVLPDDDRQWRRWLGLPPPFPAVSIQKVDGLWEKTGLLAPLAPTANKRKKSSARLSEIPQVLAEVLEASWEGIAPPEMARHHYEGWLDWLWINRWRPQIQASWQRIDAELLADFPALSSHEGQWFHPLAQQLGAPQGHAAPTSSVRTGKPAGKNNGLVTSGKGQFQSGKQSSSLPSVPSSRSGFRTASRAVVPWSDWVDPHGHLSPWAKEQAALDLRPLTQHDVVWRAWCRPLEEPARKTLWDVGVNCLASGPTPPERRTARDSLGRLIAQYGESAVADAVSKLVQRPLPPADALPFLVGILRAEDEGTPAERKARARRAHVAL